MFSFLYTRVIQESPGRWDPLESQVFLYVSDGAFRELQSIKRVT